MTDAKTELSATQHKAPQMHRTASQDFSDSPSSDYDDLSVQPSSGEEELRFIRNFHDIFLSIGLSLFAAGLGIFSFLMATKLVGFDFDGDLEGNARQAIAIVGVVSLVNAAIMWGVGEIFARSRRLFLPAIVILLSFVSFVTAGVVLLYLSQFGNDLDNFDTALNSLTTIPLVAMVTLTFATLAYYARMKLPFAMGAGGVGLTGVVVSTVLFLNPDLVTNHYWTWLFLSGVFLFFLGIYFDSRDPARRTRLSDNGFWLHFFAAPMIFYAILGGVIGGFSNTGTLPALITLVTVVIFAMISLIINRRALLVSGLLSAAGAIGYLVSSVGMDGLWTAGLTLLLLGAAMVLLGGGWKTVRRLLISPFPKSGWIARIVPPETIID